MLRLGDNDPTVGTLTVTPGRYAALHVLSSSGASPGADNMGSYAPTNIDVTLNFADGSVTLPGALLTHDWTFTNTLAPGPLPPIALTMSDRGQLVQPITDGTSMSAGVDHRKDPEFALYESALDLASLGLQDRTLESITFQDPAPAPNGTISIFAIDATAVPEPSMGTTFGFAILFRRRRRAI